MGYQTPVTLNPQTGELSLTNAESKLLLPLLRIPELIDTLSDIELKMAREAKPQETVEGIAAQIKDLQVPHAIILLIKLLRSHAKGNFTPMGDDQWAMNGLSASFN